MTCEKCNLIQIPIEYGNTFKFNKKSNPMDEKHDYKWKLFVRSKHCPLFFEHFVKSVTFKLHSTYSNPIRKVLKPPFEVEDDGYAEFDAGIDIELHNISGLYSKHINFHYYLRLTLDNVLQSPSDNTYLNENTDVIVLDSEKFDNRFVIAIEPCLNKLSLIKECLEEARKEKQYLRERTIQINNALEVLVNTNRSKCKAYIENTDEVNSQQSTERSANESDSSETCKSSTDGSDKDSSVTFDDSNDMKSQSSQTDSL